MKPQVNDRLAAVGRDAAIGVDRIHPSVRAAVAACFEADGPSRVIERPLN
jgi:hypothetical protein